ncbi:hypothetical protein [Flavobacterium psychrotrophum]|uniref:hypothetical protein n=1 Tax=Flavobacterium psychrotrophum TaxID=2294119 RepID=UPI000E322B4E|nr:hypothetical protein [Flavobacterium psychrotrophum]
MYKLTIRETAFIDHYLENSGVEYLDIRMEMADHVATAIEVMEGDDFDENFRLYMLAHKAELLANYKQFKKAATYKALKIWGKTALTPWALLMTNVIAYAGFYFGTIEGVEEITWKMNLVFLVAFFSVSLPILINGFKKKYAVASRLITLAAIPYIISNIGMRIFTDNLLFISLFYSVITMISITMTVAGFRLIKQYKLRYDG